MRNFGLIRKLFLVFFLFVGVSGEAVAVDLAGSGDTLAVLQQIQGQWRTACSPVVGSKRSFEIKKLDVSYTHFNLKTTQYKNGLCVIVENVKEDRYKFVIRGAQVIETGEAVFAVDYQQEQSFGSSAENGLYPLNILLYEDGQILLGDDFYKSKGGRLNRVDRLSPFIR